MKRIIMVFMCVVAMTSAFLLKAQEAGGADADPLKFEVSNHDFGNIRSTDGAVSCEFKFVNTADQPAVILMVTNGGCGCTTPSYPRKPVAAGKSATVKITFDPTGRRGEFNREVKVRYQVGKKKYKTSLTFEGAIVPE